jgi:NAD dependent epimerase/dehydratase family enzyme
MAGEMAEELLLSGQRVLPSQLLEDGFQFLYPNLKAALRTQCQV